MIVAGLAVALTAITPWKQELWRDPARPGAIVYAVSCDPRHDVDEGCSRFQIGKDPRFVPAGGGYLSLRAGGASVIWSRRPGEPGPDVVLLGDPSGSGGCMDLVAVTFELGPQIELSNLCAEDHPAGTHGPNGPRITFIPRHSRIVSTLRWNNGEFEPAARR